HLLAVDFHPGVTIVGLGDFVRHHLNVFLYHVFFEATTDQTLYRVQGVVRVGHGLTLGRLADENFTVIGIRNDRGRGASAFGVLDHLDVAVFQNGHTGVGGAQVDTDNFAHVLSPETSDLSA